MHAPGDQFVRGVAEDVVVDPSAVAAHASQKLVAWYTKRLPQYILERHVYGAERTQPGEQSCTG